MELPAPFGPYELKRLIGAGGMARVYEARLSGPHGFVKRIAIKMMLPAYVDDEEFVTMLIDEAKIAAALNHSNICQIHDLGRIDECYYIAMEYVEGADLNRVVNKSLQARVPIPYDIIAHIGHEITAGLHYAHAKTNDKGQPLNIIHRDISPANILISMSGEVKIVDFGVAKAAHRTQHTTIGVVKGKYQYMSPEQITGKDIDHRSDIFAVGIVLYETIAGQMMYPDGLDMLDRIRKAKIRPLEKVRRSVPPELLTIIKKALSRKADDRYQTGGEMGDALAEFLLIYRAKHGTHRLDDLMTKLFAPEGSAAPGEHRPSSERPTKKPPASVEHRPTKPIAPPNIIEELDDDSLLDDDATVTRQRPPHSEQPTVSHKPSSPGESWVTPASDQVAAPTTPTSSPLPAKPAWAPTPSPAPVPSESTPPVPSSGKMEDDPETISLEATSSTELEIIDDVESGEFDDADSVDEPEAGSKTAADGGDYTADEPTVAFNEKDIALIVPHAGNGRAPAAGQGGSSGPASETIGHPSAPKITQSKGAFRALKSEETVETPPVEEEEFSIDVDLSLIDTTGEKAREAFFLLKDPSGRKSGPFSRSQLDDMSQTGDVSFADTLTPASEMGVTDSSAAGQWHPPGLFIFDPDTSFEKKVITGLKRSVKSFNLQHEYTARVFVDLALLGREGIVVFDKPGVHKKIVISQGKPVYASSNIADEQLGHKLVELGRLKPADLTRGLEHALEQKKPLLVVLAELGLVPKAALDRTLEGLIRARLLELFRWKFGHAAFYPGEFVETVPRHVKGDLTTFVIDGVNQAVGPDGSVGWLRVHESRTLILSGEPAQGLELLGVPPKILEFLTRFTTPLSVREVIEAVVAEQLDDEQIASSVVLALNVGYLAVVTE